jgi:hypothetical protein
VLPELPVPLPDAGVVLPEGAPVPALPLLLVSPEVLGVPEPPTEPDPALPVVDGEVPDVLPWLPLVLPLVVLVDEPDSLPEGPEAELKPQPTLAPAAAQNMDVRTVDQ